MIRYHYNSSEGPQWLIPIPGKFYTYVTLSHMLGHNPQRLLTDQRPWIRRRKGDTLTYYSVGTTSFRDYLSRRMDFTKAEDLRDAYRDAFPAIKDFWNTELGEPYDPERYRKD